MVVEQRSWVLTGATVACVAALYLPCTQKAVPGGDSGELITAACELGVAHPPGYPIFTLLAWLALSLLPYLSLSVSPAHSVNLLSSLLGAGASGALCFTVCRLAGPGPGAVLAGGVFAVSRLSWQWSVVAEVFSLNNLFVGLLFSLTTSFHCADSAPQRRKVAHWGALCCGLGLCNQHTLVLYVVVIIPWVLLQLYSHRELSVCGLMSLGLCFLGGFLPYVYLPISSYLNTARWSWGDQTSLSGLLTHLLRTEYGTFSLAKIEGTGNLSMMLQAQLDHCMADLSLPVLVLAGLGLFLFSWDRRRCVVPWLLTAMLLLYSLFFAWRANLDISRPLLLGVVERFWLQSDAVVCVLAGLGLSWTHTGLERRLGHGGLWQAGGWLFTVGLLAHMVHSNHRECDQSINSVVERFGRELLASVPPDSIILTRGDLPGNSLRYLHYCQGVRPDVHLVDQEMMTYSWYVAKLGQHHPRVNFPGRWWDPVHTEEKDSFSLEQFLSHNTQGAVLACIGLPDGDPSWERSFSRWPLGVCDYLVPAQEHFHPEEWARRTRYIYNWTEPHNSFHPGSWERVANEEMWQARMKTAFFLFDLAERIQGEGKARLFELSYTLYKEIVEAHTDYPPNWDKNLALASERLLRSGKQGHSPDSLLTCSIQHFSLYLDKEPTDSQAPAIRTAVSHLLQERTRLWQRPTP
ncbi:transmembrane protein 260 [Coregonus clupeaformis]|uniref:transmembrane protein 260 n=1 Tax=Coregonus clupeaformis TaxID=59861 RepID=UPI001E1C3709|nr:transmembrane protein 260 [Coregonus clupeaformis]XP_041703626.2 transmembrane protein 260 [Coregonus clupeaformis]